MPEHVVAQGDCISSVAFAYGFLPTTLWNHHQNAELRARRRDPNVLLPGDRIFIPEKTLREEPRPVDQRHRFVMKGVPCKFKIRLLRNRKPRANKQYTLEIDGRLLNGTTDNEGWITQAIPPNATGGTLTLTESGEQIPIQLGWLDPLEDALGVQERLRNLGYYNGPIGAELSEDARMALRAFQRDQGLPPTSQIDDAAKQALKSAHGS